MKFWLVWTPSGSAPTVQHGYEANAKKEAERLARANPGKQFFVMEALGCYLIPEPAPIWTELQELPF